MSAFGAKSLLAERVALTSIAAPTLCLAGYEEFSSPRDLKPASINLRCSLPLV